MGAWFETVTKKELTKWKWFWDRTNKTLYEKIAIGWRRYKTIQRNGQRTRHVQQHFLNYTVIGPDIDITLQRTTVYKTSLGLRITGGADTINTDEYDNYNENWTSADKSKYRIKALKTER